MAASARKHRMKKRHRKKNENIAWTVAGGVSLILALTLFLLLSSNGPASMQDAYSKTPLTLRLERCRSSCDEMIFSSAGQSGVSPQTGSLVSSGALSSAAVDALFLLRDFDEAPGDSRSGNDVDDGGRSRKIDRRQSRGGRTTRKTDDSFVSGVAVKPRRLPPLIETLIGTVDEQYHSEHWNHGGKRGKGRNVIRNDARNPVVDKSEPSSLARRQKGLTGDDTVAMAAAAAAAAVWSETRDAGKHRMKTLNEEWEASLRWIAGWGQHQMGTTQRDRLGMREEEKVSSRNRKRGEKNLGEKRASKGKFKEGSEEISRMWDVCVEDCLASAEHSRTWGSSLGEQRLLGVAGNAVVSFASSWLLGKKQLKRKTSLDLHHRSVLVAFFQIALSSLLVCSLRSLWQRWVSTKPATSFSFDPTAKWLLDDEEEVNTLGGRRKKWGDNQTMRKKGSAKKGRRRKNAAHTQQRRMSSSAQSTDCSQLDSRDEGMQVNSGESPAPQGETKCESDDDSSVEETKGIWSTAPCTTAQTHPVKGLSGSHTLSGGSVPPSSLQNCKSDQEGAETMKVHASVEGQLWSVARREGPKRKTPSPCSDSDEDTPPLSSFHHLPLSTPSSVSSSPTLSPIGTLPVRAPTGFPPFHLFAAGGLGSYKNDPVGVAIPMRGVRSTPTTAERGGQAVAYGGIYDDSRATMEQISDSQDMLRKNSQAIPTDEQREEASRQLRVYQARQLQKILEKRRMESENGQREGANVVATNSRNVRSFADVASCSPVGSSGSVSPAKKTSVIAPPPGMVSSRPTAVCTSDIVSGHSEQSDVYMDSDDFLADDRLLLSNMLDEDEDDVARQESSRKAPSASVPARVLVDTGNTPTSRSYVAHSNVASNAHSTWGSLPLQMSLENNGSNPGQASSTDLLTMFCAGSAHGEINPIPAHVGSCIASLDSGASPSWGSSECKEEKAENGSRVW